MKIRCIEQGNNTYLTVGKEYEVVRVDRNFYTIINDSNSNFRYDKYLFVEVKDMKKSDLKTGMIVEYRNGLNYIVFKDTEQGDYLAGTKEHNNLDYHDDDLKNNSFKEHDIIRVYKTKSYDIRRYIKGELKLSELTLLWERKDNSEEIKKIKDEITKAQNTLIEAQRKLSELESGR